jgi:excisionase family DNA binding protein
MPRPRTPAPAGLTVRDLDARRLTAGLTLREAARMLRVSPDRIRAWIVAGELGAVNVATTRCGKPRLVILPAHLAEWERRRVSPPPRPRRRRRTRDVDFYPD